MNRMYTYTCEKCKGLGKQTEWDRTQQSWLVKERNCWKCGGTCVITLPKAVVEYRKRVQQLSEELKVQHSVWGYECDENYEYEDNSYNASDVEEYYDHEPLEEPPAE